MKTNNLYKQRPSQRAKDLIATYRALGMSDDEIIAEMKKLQAAKNPPNNANEADRSTSAQKEK